MSYKNEIKKQLEGVPRDFCAAFAVRSALRVLPLLAIKEKNSQPFWYWFGKDKEKYLLAILTASHYGLAVCSSSKEKNRLAAVTALAATALAAYAAANIQKHYKTETQSDLLYLKNDSDIHTYLHRPLWDQELPNDLEVIWHRFQQWTKQLDAGFEVWLDWYQDRLEGKTIDLGLLEKQVNISAEKKAQGVKAVNAHLAQLTESTKLSEKLQPLNLVRTIFIGNGAAGKTSLN